MNKLPLLLACLAGTAEAAAYRGETLESALERLRAEGVELLYSSDLVKPWMRIEQEPRATETQALLEEILAPHGIVVADGPDGALMLVREASPRRAARRPVRHTGPRRADRSRVGARAISFRRATSVGNTSVLSAPARSFGNRRDPCRGAGAGVAHNILVEPAASAWRRRGT